MPDIFNAFGKIVRAKRFDRTEIAPGYPVFDRETLSGTLRVRSFSLSEDPLTGVLRAVLALEENELGAFHSQEAKLPTRVTKELTFSFEVEGKEVPLLSGLLKKDIKVSGQIDRVVLEKETLMSENLALREQLEEQSYQLSQVQQSWTQRQIPAS